MYQKERENDRSDKADQESVSGFADGLKRKQKVQRDASLYSFLRRQGIQPSAKRSASGHHYFCCCSWPFQRIAARGAGVKSLFDFGVHMATDVDWIVPGEP